MWLQPVTIPTAVPNVLILQPSASETAKWNGVTEVAQIKID
jgi:hypothetical protein